MTLSKLQYIFKYHEFIEIDKYIFYDDGEIYDIVEDISIYPGNLSDALKYVLNDGETLNDKLDKINFSFNYSGGRGAGSSKKPGMGGGFTSANTDVDNTKPLPSAYFNALNKRFTSPEQTFRNFENKYANKNIEYGLSIDEEGFVHTHVKGNPHSVAINARAKNHVIIHNHPGGGQFSKADLLVAAKDKKAKGIIATGVKENKLNRYHLEKSKHFKAKEFSKAVNKAKWPANLSYDQGASWWLKKNQKKYGYKFTETHSVYKTSKKGKNVILQDQLSLF